MDSCWSFPPSINDTIIFIIPKVDNPKGMKDLRPISLCNVVCKILAKVLASILKEVLDKCVSEEQSVFVLRRSIVDNALVVAKIMHYLKCKKAGRKDDVTLKIYISKAIYKINWGYLRAMLLKIVFHDIFVGWIMMHVSSFKFFT